MNILLHRIRTLLIVAPAIVTLITMDIDTYAAYTSFVLLALIITKAGSLYPRAAKLLLLVELIGFGWLSYTYGSVLFLLLFSTLIGAFGSRPNLSACAAWTIGGAAVLLTSLPDREPEIIIAALLLWTMTAVILYAANQYEDKQHRVEELYEALAHSHEELESARRRMLDYASQIEQYAQTEERNRIAKDIHDDLGHRLIRVKMMSEAALQLFHADTKRAYGLVEQIRDQLQDSMERMRRTVRRLAAPDEGDNRRYALDRLVAESGEALGIEVLFEVQGIPRPLYPSLEFILFKNAQEAITNALRHGAATAVAVVLDFRADSVALTISNNGTVPNEPIEAGLGMKGMRERIALIGGKLEWRAGDQFSVTTIMPLLG